MKCLIETPETGEAWDESLELFKTGKININFYNNIVSYTAGDCVSGTIDIDLQETIHCQSLSLVFCGVERAHLDVSEVITMMEYHRDCKEIVKLCAVVVEFPSLCLDKGQYTYPFMLYLPDWLPDSLDYRSAN